MEDDSKTRKDTKYYITKQTKHRAIKTMGANKP